MNWEKRAASASLAQSVKNPRRSLEGCGCLSKAVTNHHWLFETSFAATKFLQHDNSHPYSH